MAEYNSIQILRLQQVIQKAGLSRSTIYALMQEDKFPKPIRLGIRAVGWVESDIDAWIRQKVSERDGRLYG